MSNSTTRLNYDELNLISKTFHAESEACTALYTLTRRKQDALRSEWNGQAAEAFYNEMDDKVLPAVRRLSAALLTSESTLNQIAQTIYEADLETCSYFKGLDGGTVGGGNQGISVGDGLLSSLGNLYNADKNFLDIMTTFIKDPGKLKLKGPLASFGLGAVYDITKRTYGDNWGKALGVNFLDATVQFGLGIVFPPVGAVLLVNSGIQLIGNLGIAAEKIIYSFTDDPITRQLLLEQADLKSQALENMDLGNITKSFSESVFDGFIFTDQGQAGLVKTVKSTEDILYEFGFLATK